jgi:hypothetical protein
MAMTTSSPPNQSLAKSEQFAFKLLEAMRPTDHAVLPYRILIVQGTRESKKASCR